MRKPLTVVQNDHHLADHRYITAVLRLDVDGAGRLAHGELVSADAVVLSRFEGWKGLVRAVQVWAAGLKRDLAPKPSQPGS